ncbi:MAG TPA: cytochrome c oxidase subunit II [Terriglobales bacterium]|nr:cytochrome c oxidase subunit II [Terriglobales bacterium]
MLFAGCSSGGPQSILDPAGPQAQQIEDLWWLFFTICTLVYVIVIAFLAVPIWRRHQGHSDSADRPLQITVGVATAATILILFVLAGASYSTGRALSELPTGDALIIRVTGRQWWWEITYPSATPSDTFTTANELHIPVGRAVVLELDSADVIHSFWAPNLTGKRDLIPGRPTSLAFRSDRPGTFRAQCAELCGVQHALMAMPVIADPPEAFEAWLSHQRSSAAQPQTDEQRRGQQIFLSRQCASCHRIQGTSAGATNGPDLTHIASRGTLAAGTLPNTREHLADWIRDPQQIKPGNKMPPVPLATEELDALLAYLLTLR